MVEIEKPRIECIDSQDDVSYGKYIVEPLERGYGTTLGNSLRRILLSSLPADSCSLCGNTRHLSDTSHRNGIEPTYQKEYIFA